VKKRGICPSERASLSRFAPFTWILKGLQVENRSLLPRERDAARGAPWHPVPGTNSLHLIFWQMPREQGFIAQSGLLGHAGGKGLAESPAELSAGYSPVWELELPPGPRGTGTAAGMCPALPSTRVLGTGGLTGQGHHAEGEGGLGTLRWPCKAAGVAAPMVALPAAAAVAPGICWHLHGASFLGEDIAATGLGEMDRVSPAGIQPCAIRNTTCFKARVCTFQLLPQAAPQPPAWHRGEQEPMQPAAGPRCTFRLCAASELKPLPSPGPLALLLLPGSGKRGSTLPERESISTPIPILQTGKPSAGLV